MQGNIGRAGAGTTWPSEFAATRRVSSRLSSLAACSVKLESPSRRFNFGQGPSIAEQGRILPRTLGCQSPRLAVSVAFL
jgi:hypothetical protein